jgi:thiamine transport system permease protein
VDSGLGGYGSSVKNSLKWRGLLLAALPLIFLAVFYFFPLFKILDLSFRPEGRFDSTGLLAIVTHGRYLHVIWFTLWQAVVSTVLTLLIGLPGAYVFARYRFPAKSLVLSLTSVPFVLPTLVVAAAFRALLGPAGLANTVLADHLPWLPQINIDQTVWFILLAHVFYNYTLVVRLVGGFWSRLQPALVEAARTMGASPIRAFREVTLPLLMPAIFAAGLLVFVFCFTSFGVVLILGGPRLATIEVEIYRQAVHIFNLPLAATLSIFQILFTAAVMWVYSYLGGKASVTLHPQALELTQRIPKNINERLMVYGNLALMAVLLATPLAALVIQSFSAVDGWTLAFYRELFFNRAQSIFFVPPIQAIFNSLGFALFATVLAVVLGGLAAKFLARPEGRAVSLWDPLFMLPLSTSAVTLGFGFIIALNKPPLNLRSSWVLVPIAHTLVALPFVIRSLLPALRGLPRQLKEAAHMLGASPLRAFWHVELPIVSRALLVGAVFAFSVSLGEFGATAFVARPQTPTMPVAIYQFLGRVGTMNYGQAMAMSTLLMLVTTASFLVLDKVRKPGGGNY